MTSQTESLFRNDDPAYEPQESSAARLFRWFIYGFAGLCAAGVLVWVLTGNPDKPVPVIKGSGTPDRAAAADDPARVSGQDQPIYERLAAGSNTERGQELLPASEQPMSREQLAAAIDRQQLPAVPSAAEPADSPQVPAGSDAAAPATTGGGEQAAPPAADPAPPAQVNAPPAVTKQAEAQTSGYWIQVASVLTEDQAKSEWARISRQNSDLLARLEGLYPTFTNSKGNTYYRVQGGPLVDEALANLLCSQLKARKVDCLVIEP